ncbi:hypothetical protein [Moorena sp. SIO3H5]|uniref:hypothetical protein n=1 Tax=Moorena sp. SIO3H5 TaxID=2607834 RepID=UPI0013B81778|nr:hypothetical protein [Moorena sp. SIO3H5]NEO68802.1 hypothetical protein [Moorena sp. SIO3H5]
MPLPSSDFPLPTFLFSAPCSLLPAPCSLKPRHLYLTSRRIAIKDMLETKCQLLTVVITAKSFFFPRLK